MKKLITTVVVAFFFVACGGSNVNNVNDEFAGNDESVNDETVDNETPDEIVSDDEINWDVVGHEGEPCFPNNTCHEGLKCRDGKCVDDGGMSDTGKLGHECYPDGSCRSDDMICEDGICVELKADADETLTDNEVADDVATDDETSDEIISDEEVMDEEVTTDSDAVDNPVVDNDTADDPLTGIEAGHPCYPNNTCDSIKGLVCQNGLCQYPGTTPDVDTATPDEDEVLIDDETVTDSDVTSDEEVTDDDVLLVEQEPAIDDDIVETPDQDNLPNNIGNKGQSCYANHTCNGVLVCIVGTEICADEPIAVLGQYEGRCWDYKDPLTGKTTCEKEGWYWSPAIWAETSDQFPLCIGSSTRRPYLAECQLQTNSGEPRSSVWYKYPTTP